MAPAGVLELFKDFQQRVQLRRPQRARPADFLLVSSQVSRQAPLAQDAPCPGTEFPQIKLLRLAMLQVIIPAATAKAGGQSHRFKATSPVAGPPILALIDVALHQNHRMAPVLLPVAAEPFET